jgi:major membrane immunogen (membrane-anchored lipoprotein)
MTTLKLLCGTITVIILTIACSNSKEKIKSGPFEGRSQSIYTNEPFVAISEVFVSNGNIDSIHFSIVDTMNNELFDSNYEKHYTGNQEYINQCRNDWKGVNIYPKAFMKVKDLDKVDAITGATWSYNMFKSATKIALEKASIKN